MKFDAMEMSKLPPKEFAAYCDSLGGEARAERAEFWRKVRWCAFAVVAACGLAFVFFVAPALAQTAAAPSDSIPVAPWVTFVKPWVDMFVDAVVTSLAGLAYLEFSKLTGIQASASQVASLKSAAATEAGVLVANAADNLSGKSITVNSPGIAEAANRIAAALPDAVAARDASIPLLQKFIVGEIGKIQPTTTVVEPAVPPAK